jgi:membrane protein required for colicin V production
MPLTVLDVVVIVVVLISAILAMVRGFVREVLSVASWVAAAGAAYFFYKPLVPLVQPYVESGTVATIVSAAVIFFVALILASYITMRISDFVIDSRIGAIDRVFGFVFGAVRGVLLLVIALLFFNWLVPQPPAWVTMARSKPMLDDIGEKLMAALPEDAEATIMKKLKGAKDEASAPAEGGDSSGAEPPADDDDNPADDSSYGSGTRQGLDQLIENSGGDKGDKTDDKDDDGAGD